jgi:hypothetical protein
MPIQILSENEIAGNLLADSSNKLTELRLKERFLSRMSVTNKNYLQALGQIQASIRELTELKAFLEEMAKEKVSP